MTGSNEETVRSPFADPVWVVAEALACRGASTGGDHRLWTLPSPQRQSYLSEARPLVEALRSAGLLREGL